ncbi:MAG: hypothetical protein AB8B96_16600 [Lysobacterales bacterium]
MRYARRCGLCLLLLSGLAGQTFAQDVEISGAELVSGQAADRLSALAQEVGEMSGALRIVAPERWHGMIGQQLSEYLSPDRLRFEASQGQSIAFFLPGTQVAMPGGAKPLAPETPVAVTPSASDASQALRDSARSQVQNLQPQIMGADELLGRTRTLTPDLGRGPGQSDERAAAVETAPPVAPDQEAGPTAKLAAPAPQPITAGEPASTVSSSAVETEAEAALSESPAMVGAPAIVDTDSNERPGQQHTTAAPLLSTPLTAAANDQIKGKESAITSLQERLNRGRPIERSMEVGELRRADVLFSTRGVIAVVRSSGTRQRVYWLEGDINLERPEIKRERAGRYSVLRPLPKREIPEVAGNKASGPVVAEAPASADPDVAEKRRMEEKFNAGRTVDRELSVAALRPDDVLYVGTGRILVARRVQAKMKRYWLSEAINLELEEIEKTGNRRYRVRRQIR